MSEHILTQCLICRGIFTHTGKTDIAKAEKQLDHDHYGMKKVKERILEIVALNQWEDADKKGQINLP